MAETRDVSAFLERARKQFAAAEAAEADIRKEAREDLRFVAGDQWEADILDARRRFKRPALTFNKLPSFVQMVSNEARQNKPSIKFSPVDSGADKETAEVYEGIARHIQYDSDADVAYETALEYSASCSFGFFRFATEYCNNESFDLDLKIQTVYDPFSVYGILVPSCLGQKVRSAFVAQVLPRDEYEAKYPDSELVSWAFGGDMVASAGDWINEGGIRVAEYWWLETKRRKIAMLQDGTVISGKLPEGVKFKQTRIVEEDTVHSCLINGVEILPDTETEWPGSCIPIIPVMGKQLIVEGRVKLFSLIRFSRDPQQLINFAKTRIAETLGTQPISPWIAPEGSLEGREDEWNTAHLVPRSVLYYKPVETPSGQLTQAPHRQIYEPPIVGLSSFVAQEVDDIKQSTTIYDASLGAQSNETSGIAIRRRQQQSSISNLHFIDNLARAHRKGGRIIAELIPKIYDTERQVRIIGEDETERIITVNALYRDTETGKVHQYDLSAGKYDVTVRTGPSYTSKREEAFDLLSQLAQAYPDLMKVGGDIIFRNSDIPGADELAERMNKAIPPELTQKDDETGIPPQVQAQMQALSQERDAMAQQLAAAADELKGISSKERIEMAKLELERDRLQLDRDKLQADIDMGLAKIGSAEAIVHLREEVAMLKHQSEIRSREAEQAFALEQAQQVPAEESLPQAA